VYSIFLNASAGIPTEIMAKRTN